MTAAIVLTLALGIGASTAIFSIVRVCCFARCRMRALTGSCASGKCRRGDDHNVVSIGNYGDWRRQAKSFASMGAHMAPYGVSLVGDVEPVRVTAADVTVSVFRVLGVRAALGRALLGEDERGNARVLVLSHDFWRRFGQDPAVVGRQL